MSDLAALPVESDAIANLPVGEGAVFFAVTFAVNTPAESDPATGSAHLLPGNTLQVLVPPEGGGNVAEPFVPILSVHAPALGAESVPGASVRFANTLEAQGGTASVAPAATNAFTRYFGITGRERTNRKSIASNLSGGLIYWRYTSSFNSSWLCDSASMNLGGVIIRLAQRVEFFYTLPTVGQSKRFRLGIEIVQGATTTFIEYDRREVPPYTGPPAALDVYSHANWDYARMDYDVTIEQVATVQEFAPWIPLNGFGLTEFQKPGTTSYLRVVGGGQTVYIQGPRTAVDRSIPNPITYANGVTLNVASSAVYGLIPAGGLLDSGQIPVWNATGPVFSQGASASCPDRWDFSGGASPGLTNPGSLATSSPLGSADWGELSCIAATRYVSIGGENLCGGQPKQTIEIRVGARRWTEAETDTLNTLMTAFGADASGNDDKVIESNVSFPHTVSRTVNGWSSQTRWQGTNSNTGAALGPYTDSARDMGDFPQTGLTANRRLSILIYANPPLPYDRFAFKVADFRLRYDVQNTVGKMYQQASRVYEGHGGKAWTVGTYGEFNKWTPYGANVTVSVLGSGAGSALKIEPTPTLGTASGAAGKTLRFPRLLGYRFIEIKFRTVNIADKTIRFSFVDEANNGNVFDVRSGDDGEWVTRTVDILGFGSLGGVLSHYRAFVKYWNVDLLNSGSPPSSGWHLEIEYIKGVRKHNSRHDNLSGATSPFGPLILWSDGHVSYPYAGFVVKDNLSTLTTESYEQTATAFADTDAYPYLGWVVANTATLHRTRTPESNNCVYFPMAEWSDPTNVIPNNLGAGGLMFDDALWQQKNSDDLGSAADLRGQPYLLLVGESPAVPAGAGEWQTAGAWSSTIVFDVDMLTGGRLFGTVIGGEGEVSVKEVTGDVDAGSGAADGDTGYYATGEPFMNIMPQQASVTFKARVDQSLVAWQGISFFDADASPPIVPPADWNPGSATPYQRYIRWYVTPGGIPLAVSASGRLCMADVESGSIFLHFPTNYLASNWTDVDTGVEGSRPSICFDWGDRLQRLWITYRDGDGKIQRVWTEDEGGTVSMPELISEEWSQSDFDIHPNGLQYHYGIDGAAITGKIVDRSGNIVQDGITVVATDVDNSGVAVRYNQSARKWYLRYKSDGDTLTVTSDDGVTWS
jgi:hypothetical protein